MEGSSKIPLICISGPTASGKSGFAVELAKLLNGEIINADSVQVYKDFNIGSAKMTQAEMKGVPHHLLSHVEPLERYSAGRFRKEASLAAKEIYSRGKLPIITGGTGLYLRALFSGFLGSHDVSDAVEVLDRIAKQMFSLEEEQSDSHKYSFSKWCFDLLKIIDPANAEKIGEHDQFRLERALSIFLRYGLPPNVYKDIYNQEASEFLGLVFIIEDERDYLYQRINNRVEEMFNAGWLNEVNVLRSSYPLAHGLRSIGYRHINNALKLCKDLESLELTPLINNIQRDTRRFAKRQITWWKNQPRSLGWIPLQDVSDEFGTVRQSFNENLEGAFDDKVLHGNYQEIIKLVSEIAEKFLSDISDGKLRVGSSVESSEHTQIYYKRICFNQK